MFRGIPPLIALAIFAVACGGCSASTPKETEPPKTPEETVERFLTLWQERKFTEMYELVSSEAKLNITGEKFVERYTAITDETTLADIQFVLKPSATPGTLEVAYSITFATSFFGDIKQENAMTLV